MERATIHANLGLDYAGSEAINTIASNLTFSGRNIRKIVITSCEANDGKSFVGIQTAVNMGSRGKRVILVDADLRLSVLNSVYDITLSGGGQGLAHYLSGQCELDQCVYETNIPNVFLLPIGTDVQAPLSLIATPEFANLMQTLGDTFDMVIVDAPPVGMVIDAAEIAKSCDGSVLVLEYRKTRIRGLQDAYQQMMRTGTPVLGCILNKVSMDRLSTKKYYYKYGGKYGKYGKYGRYGYGYGYKREYSRDSQKKK